MEEKKIVETQGMGVTAPDSAAALAPYGLSPCGSQAEPPAANVISDAWAVFKQAMHDDPEYAWSWHCNLAVPIMDAIGVTHKQANVAAAYLMSHLFECDITTHPNFGYRKSGAQQYHELRLAADRAEDAQTPGASS